MPIRLCFFAGTTTCIFVFAEGPIGGPIAGLALATVFGKAMAYKHGDYKVTPVRQ